MDQTRRTQVEVFSFWQRFHAFQIQPITGFNRKYV